MHALEIPVGKLAFSDRILQDVFAILERRSPGQQSPQIRALTALAMSAKFLAGCYFPSID
jgi:hypothetical protein